MKWHQCHKCTKYLFHWILNILIYRKYSETTLLWIWKILLHNVPHLQPYRPKYMAPCTTHMLQSTHTLTNCYVAQKAVWKIKKLLISTSKSSCFTLISVDIFNDNSPRGIILPWLLPCIYITQKWHCNARPKLDILCVRGLSLPP